MCPANVRSKLPVEISHWRSVASSETEITLFPSGDITQPFTGALFPYSVRRSLPPCSSHTFSLVSSDAGRPLRARLRY